MVTKLLWHKNQADIFIMIRDKLEIKSLYTHFLFLNLYGLVQLGASHKSFELTKCYLMCFS